MNMKFTKMHGCGNDYVYVDCTNEMIENPSEVSKYVSDRHFGIGSDGTYLKYAHLRLRILGWLCTMLTVQRERCVVME